MEHIYQQQFSSLLDITVSYAPNLSQLKLLHYVTMEGCEVSPKG